MWAVDADSLKAWPRVRVLEPGVCRVQGRYCHVLTWLMLRRLSGLAVWLTLLTMLLAATFPALAAELGRGAYTGRPIALVEWLIRLRLELRYLLTERYPDIGRAIYYQPYSQVDWHLLGVFVLLWHLRNVLAWLLARLVLAAGWPLLHSRFKVTFTPGYVIVHRRLRSLRLNRGRDGGVSFRAGRATRTAGWLGTLLRWRLLTHGWQHPGRGSRAWMPSAGGPPDEYDTVSAMQGLRGHRLATPRRPIDAERIAESCHEALNLSRSA